MENKYHNEGEEREPDRRNVLRGLATVIGGLAGAKLLAGCGPAAAIGGALGLVDDYGPLPESGTGNVLVGYGQPPQGKAGWAQRVGKLDWMVTIDPSTQYSTLSPLMAHELGHTIGLKHYNHDVVCVMHEDVGGGLLDWRQPCEVELLEARRKAENGLRMNVSIREEDQDLINATKTATWWWNWYTKGQEGDMFRVV